MEPISTVDTAITQAWDVLLRCSTSQGLLASPLPHDNYRRVWARDAVIGGLTGLLCGQPTIIEALKQTILTLAANQAANGQIPSNVGFEPAIVSYGSLAGRVDATSWWLIGACALLHNQPDPLLKHQLREPIQRALVVLKTWEMNQRGLVFTPLGGNWADEYISQGYVLYDQALRLWALRLAAHVFQKTEYAQEAERLTLLITQNYYASANDEPRYHPVAYEKAEPKPYFWFQFGPQGYDTRWDMAANALVLLLDLHPEPEKLENYLRSLASETHSWLLPVFHPVIHQTDFDWHLLAQNYSYTFKNKPYHFHNGGCWPVFMGLLGVGLAKQGLTTANAHMYQALLQALETEVPSFSFHEYWSGDSHQPGGVTPLCYTASGFLLLHQAAHSAHLSLNNLVP